MNDKWHLRCLDLTDLIATWSKDPSRGVGAVIVSPMRQVLATGYNGLPRGFKDHPERLLRPVKYDLIVHAEMNAILNSTTPLDRCTMYTIMFPCNECTKLIIQSGIKEVKYIYNPYIDTHSIKASIKMMYLAGIKHTKIVLDKEELIIDFKQKPK